MLADLFCVIAAPSQMNRTVSGSRTWPLDFSALYFSHSSLFVLYEKSFVLSLDKRTNVRYNDICDIVEFCEIITKTEYRCQQIHIAGVSPLTLR